MFFSLLADFMGFDMRKACKEQTQEFKKEPWRLMKKSCGYKEHPSISIISTGFWTLNFSTLEFLGDENPVDIRQEIVIKLYPLYSTYDILAHYSDSFPVDISLVFYNRCEVWHTTSGLFFVHLSQNSGPKKLRYLAKLSPFFLEKLRFSNLL